MSRDLELGDTCKFGHTYMGYEDRGTVGSETKEKWSKIRSGELQKLDEIDGGIGSLLGEPYKKVKVLSSSQGLPRAALLEAADKLDDDLEYTSVKTSERIFISPQSHLHQEYMQRKQQAEQNIQQTMQSLSQLKKEKHLIEHDIRKLRTRVENMRSGNEQVLKGDFIELVDGAGSGQQGDQASLDFLRSNNIYPSIVADFMEMDDISDVEEGGKLEDLPNNEKAILRKKYTMYEKWKDIYGSEISKKLDELKSELHRVERSIEETEEWLEPYARDAVMINEGTPEDFANDAVQYFGFEGESTLTRHFEFICYKGMRNTGRDLVIDQEDPTHYRVVVINGIHINFAGFEQPQSPAEGLSVATIQWHPIIVCKHVFENIFREKIKQERNKVKQLIKDYKGEIETSRGEKYKEQRLSEEMSVRDVREKIEEKVDERVPIELSAAIRRIEDGYQKPESLADSYSEDIYLAYHEVIDLEPNAEDEPSDEMLSNWQVKAKEMTGDIDASKIPETADPMGDLTYELKFDYYYDYKLGLDMFTMK